MATTSLKLFLEIAAKGAAKTVGELRQIQVAAAALGDKAKAIGQTEIKLGGQDNAIKGVADLAFQFNNVVGAVQNLAAAARPAYDFLIGANEQLSEQILKSQTNLASATRIFQGGIEIGDPTEAIKATGPAIQSAIKQIAKDTESLVGVTDTQVNQFFDSTLQNASQLIDQSKQFSDPIKSATALTKGFAASFKVAGLEASQIQSEIRSILTGEELDNSTLAKSLQISRQQVETWREQGVLVDELNSRLQVFVAGNAIAARSIGGVASNLQSLVDRIGRTSGEPLLEPIIQELAGLEQFLKANEQSITEFFKFFVEGGIDTTQVIGQQLQPAIEALIEFAEQGAGLAQNLFALATEAAQNLAVVVGPVLEFALIRTAKAAENLSDIVQTIQFREVSEQIEALEAYGRASEVITGEALKTGQALKSLNKIQEEGGKLTAQQVDRQKNLEAQAKLQVAAIDDQIAALKDLQATTPEIQRGREKEIASLERVKEALAAQSQQIRIEGKEAAQLGTSYQQLADKVKGAAAAIDRAQTTQDAGKAAKELLEALEQQADLGQITAAQAEAQLAKVASNATLEVGIQQQAQGQIAKIRKAELDRQIGDIQAQIAKVEAAEATGRLGPIESAKEVTRLKRQELQLQLADVQRNITAERNAIGQSRGSKTNLKELQAQQSELQAKLAQEAIAAEERSQQARLNLVEQAGEKRLAIAGLVEAKANAEAAKLQRQGVITAEQAEQQKLAASQKRIAAELQGERQKLTALQGVGSLSNPKAEADRQAKILASQTKLVELQSSLDESRAKSAEAAYAAVSASAERASERIAQAELAREIEVQGMVNSGVLTAEAAEDRKLTATADRIKAELALESKRLADIAASGLDPEAKAKLQREAQAKTAQLTLQLLQNQAQQEEQVRARILEGITESSAAQQRAYDAQLSAIADVNAARLRAVTEAEAASQREISALEAAGNALQRQNELLGARANLQRATGDLAQAKASIQLEQTKRAAEIQAQLASADKLSSQERLALQRELSTLGIDTSKSAIELLQQQQALEDQLAQQQQAALAQEQSQAQATLTLENQRNQLAANRALIEARINELKAKSAVLDAEAAIREQQVQAQKQVAAAQSQLQQAQRQAPGRERDRAVGAATADLSAARSESQRNAAAAQQGLTLAQQQADLSKQATVEAEASKLQQAEIADLATQTLAVQQQQALAQSQAAELARENAQALTLAKASAEAIAVAAEREAAARERSAAAAQAGGGAAPNLPGRYMGGAVQAGTAYLVGERGPEVIVPGASSVVLNQEQIARNLAMLQSAQAASYGRVLQGAAFPPAVAHGQQSLTQHIDARVQNTFVNSQNPTQDAAQYTLQAQRDIIARGRLR